MQLFDGGPGLAASLSPPSSPNNTSGKTMCITGNGSQDRFEAFCKSSHGFDDLPSFGANKCPVVAWSLDVHDEVCVVVLFVAVFVTGVCVENHFFSSIPASNMYLIVLSKVEPFSHLELILPTLSSMHSRVPEWIRQRGPGGLSGNLIH